jgi:hypothetical protein
MRPHWQLALTLLVPTLAVAVAVVLPDPGAPPLAIPTLPDSPAPPGHPTAGLQPATATVRTAIEPVAIPTRPPSGATDVEALLASLLDVDGPATTAASLRRFAARPDTPTVELFAAVVREPRCREGAGAGVTPAEFALQQLLVASRTDPAARSALGALAFDALRVPAIHRERAARAYAGSASAQEAPWLRARAEYATDPVLREALLTGLGDHDGR